MARHCCRPGRGRRPQAAIEFLDPTRSTRCSERKASGSSERRSGHLGRTRSPSGSLGPCGESAWTMSRFTVADTSSGFSKLTSATTRMRDRTVEDGSSLRRRPLTVS